jgi:signal peptidase II
MFTENRLDKPIRTFQIKHAVLLILLLLLLDQVLKIYVKTNFFYGEDRPIVGNWLRLHFIENEGMAWGWKLNIGAGKLILTLFRGIAVIWGTFYIARLIRKKYPTLLVISCCLIYAGAAGNLIDCMFYGLIFDKGAIFNPDHGNLITYDGVAQFSSYGYRSFLYGNVVDMIYCPIVRGHFPTWVPVIGGESFEFFNMVFNIADAAISVGVIILIFISRKKVRSETEIPQQQMTAV